jgi:hypothetical protein
VKEPTRSSDDEDEDAVVVDELDENAWANLRVGGCDGCDRAVGTKVPTLGGTTTADGFESADDGVDDRADFDFQGDWFEADENGADVVDETADENDVEFEVEGCTLMVRSGSVKGAGPCAASVRMG